MANVRRAGHWIFNVGDNATTVSPDRDRVLAFDREGRPLSWFDRDRVYKRSLSSDIFGRERRAGRRRYWRLSFDEATTAFASVLHFVEQAPRDGLDSRLCRRLEEILRWTPESLQAERVRFDAAYEPIGILPPDQYLSVVLQATSGCSWNRCTFCSFYQDLTFRARAPDSFRSHCHTVRDLLGRGEGLRRRVFLSSGNALVMGNDRLRSALGIARENFPGRPISGFVDVFTGERKSVEAWRELRDLGLARVHVGIETGDDALLGWLGKPGSAAASLEFVSTLKRAGLSVAVILMVGPGGEQFADDHVRNTLALVRKLPLTHEDIVYLSPFLVTPGSEYARRAAEERVPPLDDPRSDAQYETLRDGIRRDHPPVRVSRYDIREFVY